MENKRLLEEIKRIHQIIGVTPNILTESEEMVSEAGPTSTLAKKLASIFVSDVVQIGAKKYGKGEVNAIIRKVGSTLTDEEKEVMKIVTSRTIAKDASKSVLEVIAKSFAADLKSISDDSVADALTQEFKLLFRSVMTKQDADLLEKKLNTEIKKIVRAVTPESLTKKIFDELSKNVDGAKLKNLSGVNDRFIATVRQQNPGLNTTQLIEEIIDLAPKKVWTPEFILRIAGSAFNNSKDIARYLAEFAIAKPVGWIVQNPIKSGTAAMVTILGAAAFAWFKSTGEDKDWALFRKELGDIERKYPCVKGYIIPRGDYYELVMKDNVTTYPAIWEDNRLWYVENINNLKKTSEVKC
jgi:hypothetical protein